MPSARGRCLGEAGTPLPGLASPGGTCTSPRDVPELAALRNPGWLATAPAVPVSEVGESSSVPAGAPGGRCLCTVRAAPAGGGVGIHHPAGASLGSGFWPHLDRESISCWTEKGTFFPKTEGRGNVTLSHPGPPLTSDPGQHPGGSKRPSWSRALEAVPGLPPRPGCCSERGLPGGQADEQGGPEHLPVPTEPWGDQVISGCGLWGPDPSWLG